MEEFRASTLFAMEASRAFAKKLGEDVILWARPEEFTASTLFAMEAFRAFAKKLGEDIILWARPADFPVNEITNVRPPRCRGKPLLS
jgi:hypothetical protein